MTAKQIKTIAWWYRFCRVWHHIGLFEKNYPYEFYRVIREVP